MLTFILALALAASPAAEHRRVVEQAVYELCPRAMDGSLSFDDPAQLAAAGYRQTAPRQTPGGPMAQIERGSGTDRILISARREGVSATCAVWFGGPDNRALLRAVRRRARAAGYRGGNPLRLGDGTPIQMLRQGGAGGRSLTIIEANAGGDLDFDSVTTVITMSGQN